MTFRHTGPLVLAASLFALGATPTLADPFCCECKDGKKHALDESSSAFASTKCSLKCKRPTVARKGSCEAPASATSAAPTSAAKPAAGAVQLYRSEDCSGDGLRVEKSEAQLGGGYRSYQVETGVVSVHAQANFSGAGVRPVLGSLCVAPGWELGSVKIGE